MTARKPNNRAGRPKTTAVPDRSPSLALGDEAQVVAELLRRCGAKPELVPADLMDDEARDQWEQARASHASQVPLYLIDLAAAILATIPPREIARPRGRPLGRGVADVETLKAMFGSVSEAARFVAPNYIALKLAKTKNKLEPLSDREIKAHADEIKADAQRLARQSYRRRKRDMPE